MTTKGYLQGANQASVLHSVTANVSVALEAPVSWPSRALISVRIHHPVSRVPLMTIAGCFGRLGINCTHITRWPNAAFGPLCDMLESIFIHGASASTGNTRCRFRVLYPSPAYLDIVAVVPSLLPSPTPQGRTVTDARRA